MSMDQHLSMHWVARRYKGWHFVHEYSVVRPNGRKAFTHQSNVCSGMRCGDVSSKQERQSWRGSECKGVWTHQSSVRPLLETSIRATFAPVRLCQWKQ